MKGFIFAIFALAASAIASPLISERQVTTEAGLQALIATVKSHTANINATNAAAPNAPSLAQQNAAAAAMAPDFQAITDALTAAKATVTKRDFWIESRSEACDKTCLLGLVLGLVWEITCTLKVVIVKLGLACVLVYLIPLVTALGGLVVALNAVIAGLLIAVKGIVTAVLGVVAGVLCDIITIL